MDPSPLARPIRGCVLVGSLEDALRLTAQTGGIIRMKSGEYQMAETFVIRATISIVAMDQPAVATGGAGSKISIYPNVKISCERSGCVFRCEAGCLQLSGLSITSTHEMYQWSSAALEVSAGVCLVRNCRITSSCGGGVRVQDSARCSMEDVVVSRCMMRNVSVLDGAELSAFHCKFSRSKMSGLSLCRSSRVTLKHCQVSKNGLSGVIVCDDAEAKLVDSEIFENNQSLLNMADITVRDVPSRLHLTQCRIGDPGVQLCNAADWHPKDFDNTFNYSKSRCSVS